MPWLVKEAVDAQGRAEEHWKHSPGTRVLACGALLGLPQQAPRIERACDRPGLRGRAAGLVRRICVEDLADRAHRLVLERVAHSRKHVECRPCAAANAIHCEAEWPEQPRPDRPLVVAAVALHDAAAIVPVIGGGAGGEPA